MYRSTLAVYSVNLDMSYLHVRRRGCGGGLGCRRYICEALVSIKVVPHGLVGQVVHEGEHHSVGGGDHLLRATSRQAQQDTRGQHEEQKGYKQTHVQVEHF